MYAEWSSLRCMERWRHFWVLWCFTKKETICSPSFGVNREMVLNTNMISSPAEDPDQNLPCALKGRLNGGKSARLLYSRRRSQTHDACGGKSRLLLLPGIQKLAAAASRNDWKLSRGWGGWGHSQETFTEEPIHQKTKMKINKFSHPEKLKKCLRESSF